MNCPLDHIRINVSITVSLGKNAELLIKIKLNSKINHLHDCNCNIISFQGYTHLLICLLLIGVEGITTNTKSNSIPSEHLIPPPLQPSVFQRYGEPTFFQRIAGWFGYGDEQNFSEIKSNASPQLINNQPETKQNVIQERYIDVAIPAVHQSIQQPQDQAKQKPKSGCNPCNTVPWTPMSGQQQAIPIKGNIQKQFPISTQYKQLQPQYNQPPQYHHLQYQQPPPFQYTNSKVLSYNSYRNNHQQGSHFQHITLPTYTPPLIHSTPHSIQANSITSPEYQPPHQLLPIQQTQHHLIPIPLPNLSATPIPPLYDSKPFFIPHFPNNNLQSYGIPIQIDNVPVQSNSIPIPIIQNPIYIQQQVPHIPNDQLHYRSAVTPSSDIEIVKSVALGEFTSTIEYPPSIVQSPIIDLSDNTQSLTKDKYSQPEYLSEPIVVDSNERDSADSLSSASSKNFTVENEPEREIIKSDFVDSTPAKFHQTTTTTTLRPKPFKSGDSYGRTKTNVEIEASVQTANENAKPVAKKDRETPKNLLDSPIVYLKKTSLAPTTKSYTDIPEVGTTKPVIDYSPWSPSTHTGIYTTLAYVPSSTTMSSVSPTFVPVDSNGANSGMSPPPPPVTDKKPKQIQIIIPYTNKNQPRPFRANKFQSFDTSSGWSHHSNDYQDSQESQVVTATVTQAPIKKTTKYLTKILASSLRDLLKKEKSNYTSIDLSKLQKNIDGWTEQEFSMIPNKASTISFRGHSKHIPSEYLTTTTPIQQFTTTTDIIPTTSLEPLYADEEYKKVDYFGKRIEENQLNFDGGKHTTILPMPFKPNKLSETYELWNKFNVAISPVTKEKVYVVTPQPWKEYNQDESDSIGTFKSPRFSVRPTPGVATTSPAEQKLTLPESGNNFIL